MTANHVWIRDCKIYQARPIADVVNDGHPQPDNKKIKWVVFRVIPKEDFEYDAVGYATSLATAKRLEFVD